MKKLHFALLYFALSNAHISIAHAGILSFDDVTEDAEVAIADGYGGLNWSNFWVQNPILSQITDFDSGFYNGVASGGYTAFNANGDSATISSNNPFDFNSAYFATASRWGLEITATAYRNGSQLYQQQFAVNTDAAQLLNLNFTGIDRLEFVAAGGEEYLGSGFHFTMDNAEINASPVPLPGAAWLFGSIMAVFLGVKRRTA